MQFLYGSKVTASEIGEYLYYHRDSLTDWKGELFDYGDSCLWQDYLWERAGGGDLDAPLDEPRHAGRTRTTSSPRPPPSSPIPATSSSGT